MSKYPEIKNPKYHEMSFGEVDRIREKIKSGELGVNIKQTQLMLYLNQMSKKHSFILKMTQNASIISFVFMIVFIFVNWRLTLLFFIIAIVSGILVNKLANKYIFEECRDDRVFLKFALATGLVELKK
ncbi:hypothetical protein A2210_02900 [Candidatus Woesebacteria bacterium RIFOXYA1_FULL_40_18]|uniref:Uncharacterized protein n=3 Tax=Candidatus Woeseibacteriota TaxID=1752722 RepID=A0A1F8CKL9_9BACT|nr:MAG: hypothetical protein A2210_02900 [Candidatus Woesebacteria bacterium RIFOXYA1_FULL_40_18]OGM80308.1 MAG: hypothetical protein A2361_01765 [Candidatus Woesebacteria bacterium RIFOXYB1_FULL_40_26]OGM87173.1 MAG: hypothetical protein A2614_01880 [Candidatus Woesebacteria bacterium RIFOXYD1_FULL_40_21]